MKLLNLLLIAAVLSIPTYGQGLVSSKTKATLPAEQPVAARAVITKIHTTKTLTTAEGKATPNYRVVIGNDLYWATGVGPSSGIYDVELHKNYIHINISHLGVKPVEIYHLHIDLVQYAQADGYPGPEDVSELFFETHIEPVDGRHLIIYDRSTDAHGNVTFRAVATDQTGRDTYFIFSAYTQEILPGIYDFKLATVDGQAYLDLLTHPKGASPMWIRTGLSFECGGCEERLNPILAKTNYR